MISNSIGQQLTILKISLWFSNATHHIQVKQDGLILPACVFRLTHSIILFFAAKRISQCLDDWSFQAFYV